MTDPLDPPADEQPPTPADMPAGKTTTTTDKPAAKKSDKPPATRKRTRAGSSPGTGGRPTKDAKARADLERQLVEAFGMIGLGMMAIGSSDAIKADGAAVIQHAEPIALALGALAEQNPAVMRVLSAATTGGAWFGVMAAVTPLVLTIVQNHAGDPGQLPSGAPAPAGDVIAAAFGGAPAPMQADASQP